MINGLVYIQSHRAPDAGGRVGPFVKQSEGYYVCETKNQGEHMLSREEDGQWVYCWSYVQMRGQLVDARVLDDMERKAP